METPDTLSPPRPAIPARRLIHRPKPKVRAPGKIIGVVLPPATLDRVDQQAILEARSRSNMVAVLVERALRVDPDAT